MAADACAALGARFPQPSEGRSSSRGVGELGQEPVQEPGRFYLRKTPRALTPSGSRTPPLAEQQAQQPTSRHAVQWKLEDRCSPPRSERHLQPRFGSRTGSRTPTSCAASELFDTPPSTSPLSSPPGEKDVSDLVLLQRRASAHVASTGKISKTDVSTRTPSRDISTDKGLQYAAQQRWGFPGISQAPICVSTSLLHPDSGTTEAALRASSSSPGGVTSATDKLHRSVVDGSYFLVDAEALVLGMRQVMDVFRGALLLLMGTTQMIMWMSSTQVRNGSLASLLLCNAASAQCVGGILLSFGFTYYGQYLRAWPDPLDNKLQVFKTGLLWFVCIWICNLVWAFVGIKAEVSLEAVKQLIIFEASCSRAADLMFALVFNFKLVYWLWHPVQLTIARCMVYGGQHCGELVAFAVTILPGLLFASNGLSFAAVCSWHPALMQGILVCPPVDASGISATYAFASPDGLGNTPHRLPALPYLFYFNLGVLLAVCWDRFLADLRPVLVDGGRGTSGMRGLSELPPERARHWCIGLVVTSLLTATHFVPVGQIWLFEDLSRTHVETSYGELTSGYMGGPSILWLLGTLWPIGVMLMSVSVLVLSARIPVAGWLLRWLVNELEHCGCHFLYYSVVVEIGLAGMFRGREKRESSSLDIYQDFVVFLTILAIGRFLMFLARAGRQ